MATDFNYEIKKRIRQSPSLYTIILINAGVSAIIFLSSLLHFTGIDFFFPDRFLSLPSSTSLFFREPWTLFTYMFTHVSLLHLIFNMLWFYWFGSTVLDAYNDKRLAEIYLLGGAVGGVFYILANLIIPGLTPGGSLCGASAAVLAVMTVATLKFPNRKFNLFIIGELKLKWIAIGSLLLLMAGAGGGLNVGGGLAHVGGVASGVAYYFLSGSLKRKRNRPKKLCPQKEKEKRNVSDADRLDVLLDKIRLSGYPSLSSKEQKELKKLSENMKRQ